MFIILEKLHAQINIRYSVNKVNVNRSIIILYNYY